MTILSAPVPFEANYFPDAFFSLTAATVGIEDKAGVWDTYVKQKKERGDYENPQLGYDKK